MFSHLVIFFLPEFIGTMIAIQKRTHGFFSVSATPNLNSEKNNTSN